MIPKAKKKLHACKQYLENLLKSKHFEEVEIILEAFVNSARNVTFVLQKEFKKNPRFKKWYGDSKKELEEGTKQYEMKNDELCKFFKDLRNKIIKEGINGLVGSIVIRSINTNKDYPNRPAGADLNIGLKGVYFHINKGTSKEDLIPAPLRKGITQAITLNNPPTQHLGQKIEKPNLFIIMKLYYKYLENLVEEWTGILG